MSGIWKKALLAIAVAASFLVGYAGVSEAWPGVADRGSRHGYFQNRYDPSGQDVIVGGIYSRNADQFVNDVMRHLRGPCCRQRTGAEFIIHTMIGSSPSQRSRPPSQAQINDWSRRVHFAEAMGRVNWSRFHGYSVNSYFQDNWNDAGFFYDNGASDSIVFYNANGSVAYALRKICANPLGNPTGLPPAPPDFRFDGESWIDGTDRGNPSAPYVTARKNLLVHPGDTVNFFHRVWNYGTGGGSTRYAAWQRPRDTTPTPSAQWQLAPPMQGSPFRPNPGDIFLSPGQNVLVNWNGFRIPANAPVGATYCQHIGFTWTAWDKPYPTDKHDRKACAEVTYAYELTPTTTVSRAVAASGDQVTFSYRVQNTGPTISQPANWGTHIRTITPTTTPQQLPAEDRDFGDYRQNGDFDKDSNNNPLAYTVGTHPMNSATATNGAMTTTITVNGNPGDKICSSGGIEPTSSSGVELRYSAESCVTIAKFPNVHFMGGDIGVGFPYTTSALCGQATPDDKGGIYTMATASGSGSVVEYAAFAQGIIQFQQAARQGFGTASRSATDRDRMERLSFANTPDAGNFGSSDCMFDYHEKYSSQIPLTGGSSTINLSEDRESHYNRDVVVTGTSNIQPGARIIIVVDGDVRIRGDIRYPGNYGSVDDIPSLAIIASGNITIEDQVTRLDGVYISKGTIHTCDITTGPLSTSDCNQALTVNGIIMTNELNLRRTFGGSGANTSEPAERFNFTTEMLFNNVLDDRPAGLVETIEERDLPPRY